MITVDLEVGKTYVTQSAKFVTIVSKFNLTNVAETTLQSREVFRGDNDMAYMANGSLFTTTRQSPPELWGDSIVAQSEELPDPALRNIRSIENLPISLEIGRHYLTNDGTILSVVRKLSESERENHRLKDDVWYFLTMKDGSDRSFVYNEEGLWVNLESGVLNHDRSFHANLPEEQPLDGDAVRRYFEHLRIWGEKTFGPVIPSRIVQRAKEEMDKELVREVEGDVWTDKALEEAADVVVILTRAPGLWDAIERKMAINYDRRWDVKGDGTGYHIPK